jgi:hypothetical protein
MSKKKRLFKSTFIFTDKNVFYLVLRENTKVYVPHTTTYYDRCYDPYSNIFILILSHWICEVHEFYPIIKAMQY